LSVTTSSIADGLSTNSLRLFHEETLDQVKGESLRTSSLAYEPYVELSEEIVGRL